MGYRIKKVPFKKGPGWKLQLITYPKENERKTQDIPRDEWRTHGFTPDLTFEEAQQTARSINAENERKRVAERKAATLRLMKKESETINANFPTGLLRDFERIVLRARKALTEKEKEAQSKRESHWKAAKKVIVAVNLDYPDWAEQKVVFFDHFAHEKISYSYVQKITRLMNEWGAFCAKRQGKYFADLPLPTGREKERICDRYFEKAGQGKESSPLTWQMLKAVDGKMIKAQWNWLYMTVWFGLRPGEANNLKDSRFTEVLFDDVLKVPVLKVYQPKLVSLRREDRFKFIPCNYPEQIAGLELLEKEDIDVPLVKTVQGYFGDTVNLYGGRKGFEKMLLDKGEQFENISAMLGHQTVDRTWQNYRNRKQTRYRKAQAA